MTKEELIKVPFKFVSHVNMEHEHASDYVNTDYRYKDKVYKSLPKFLEAIKNVEFKG